MRAAVAHSLVACVEHEDRVASQGPPTPRLEFLIQKRGCPRHIRRAHVQTTELTRDLDHAPRGYALDVHLGLGQPEHPLATLALLEILGIEHSAALDIANLGPLERHLADARRSP